MERENETYHLAVGRRDCGAGCRNPDLDYRMKTFKWTKTRPALEGEWRHTLLEIKIEGGRARFWSVLQELRGGFRPVVFAKDRSGYQTIFDVLSLDEARLAVEKYLMDNGVIDEGDRVEYEE